MSLSSLTTKACLLFWVILKSIQPAAWSMLRSCTSNVNIQALRATIPKCRFACQRSTCQVASCAAALCYVRGGLCKCKYHQEIPSDRAETAVAGQGGDHEADQCPPTTPCSPNGELLGAILRHLETNWNIGIHQTLHNVSLTKI